MNKYIRRGLAATALLLSLPAYSLAQTSPINNVGMGIDGKNSSPLALNSIAVNGGQTDGLGISSTPTWVSVTLTGLGGAGTQCVQVNNAGMVSGAGSPCGIGGGGASLGANTFTGTQTVTPGANTSGLVVSSASLTGSGDAAFVSVTGTWNTSGSPPAIFANITNTASGASARLLDLQVGSVSKFSVDPDGLAQAVNLTLTGLTGILSSNGSSGTAARTLTGTSNRLTITNGDGTAGNPTFDLAATYVGQSSITTLGTIATGVWQGTIVGATYGGTGVNNGAKTLTLGASLITTGAGSPTLAFPASSFTYTYPSASKTLMASDYSNGTTLTSNAFLTGGGAAAAPNSVVITGLVLGAGASAPGAYVGTSCTNQFPRSLNASGAATCASVATADFTGQLALAKGGTNADLSATGGTSQFVKQASAGAAFTVIQPTFADIASGTSAATVTSLTLVTPALGTPASGNLANTTGFPTANLSGLGTGVATFLATPSSANLATAITDETGSGALVFGTGPTISGATLSGGATLTGGLTATGQTISGGTFSGPTLSGTINIPGSGQITSSGILGLGGSTVVSGYLQTIRAANGTSGTLTLINNDWVTSTTGTGLAFFANASSGNTSYNIQVATAGGSSTLGTLALNAAGGGVSLGSTVDPGSGNTLVAGLLKFTGLTSAFPALKRSGTTLQHRLADDSADGPMSASSGTFSGDVIVGAGSPPISLAGLRVTGNAATTFLTVSDATRALLAGIDTGAGVGRMGMYTNHALQIMTNNINAITISAGQLVALPAIATGTPVASLCIDASNNIIKKTTSGACI